MSGELRSSLGEGTGLLAAAFGALDLSAAVASRGFGITAAIGTLLDAAPTEDSFAGLRRAGGERSETETESKQGGKSESFHIGSSVWLAA